MTVGAARGFVNASDRRSCRCLPRGAGARSGRRPDTATAPPVRAGRGRAGPSGPSTRWSGPGCRGRSHRPGELVRSASGCASRDGRGPSAGTGAGRPRDGCRDGRGTGAGTGAGRVPGRARDGCRDGRGTGAGTGAGRVPGRVRPSRARAARRPAVARRGVRRRHTARGGAAGRRCRPHAAGARRSGAHTERVHPGSRPLRPTARSRSGASSGTGTTGPKGPRSDSWAAAARKSCTARSAAGSGV
ncbi:hypothetical protein RKD26_005212 [Streptomyces calvus]